MSATVDHAAPSGAGSSAAALLWSRDLLDDPEATGAWVELATTARHANPFLGPALLAPALRHLAGPDDVRLLTVGAPGRLDLLLPVATRRRVRRAPVRASVGWAHTHHFLGTPLVAPTLDQRGWRAALGALRESGDAWFVLPQTDVDVVREVEAAAAGLGLATRRLDEQRRPVTHRHEHDDYAELRLSGRRRKELRRVRRRLDERLGGGLGLVDLAAGATPQALETALQEFLALEAAGWKGTDGGAIAGRPAERVFFLEACRALAAQGRLEVLALRGREGRAAAMALVLRDGDTQFTFKIAYDEQHAACSPGLLLYLDQLSRFHDSGAALVDTCAAPDHPMARRLHGDDRTLVTLAVALGPRRGALAVRWARAVATTAAAVRRHRSTTDPREDRP